MIRCAPPLQYLSQAGNAGSTGSYLSPSINRTKETDMNTTLNGARIATLAAAFAVSSLAFGAEPPAGSMGKAISASDKVHCYGVHSCKGESDCKTTDNACKGKNECKGHGFKAMEAGKCLSTGGVIGDVG